MAQTSKPKPSLQALFLGVTLFGAVSCFTIGGTMITSKSNNEAQNHEQAQTTNTTTTGIAILFSGLAFAGLACLEGSKIRQDMLKTDNKLTPEVH